MLRAELPPGPGWDTRWVELLAAVKALGVLAILLWVPGEVEATQSWRALLLMAPAWVWEAFLAAAALLQVAAVWRHVLVARMICAVAMGTLFEQMTASVLSGPLTPTLAFVAGDTLAMALAEVVLIVLLVRGRG